MDGQQKLVDYISEQLRAGFSEASLRQHLEAHGWAKPAIDSAFDRYNQRTMPKPAPIAGVKRKHRVRIPKWTRARFMKLGVAFAVLLIAGAATYLVMFAEKPPQRTVEAQPLTYAQKQSLDVVTVGGTMATHVAGTDGDVPTFTSIASDGHLLLCGTTCDPTVSEVGTLVVYKPSGVKFVPYTSGLTVPNKETMYLVPGGTCQGRDALGGQNVNPKAFVLLYARNEDSGLIQRCVTL